jgi:hypothetical protein
VHEELFLYFHKGPYGFIKDNMWKGKPVDERVIATEGLHCLTSFYLIFYRNKKETVKDNMYDLCTLLVLFN